MASGAISWRYTFSEHHPTTTIVEWHKLAHRLVRHKHKCVCAENKSMAWHGDYFFKNQQHFTLRAKMLLVCIVVARPYYCAIFASFGIHWSLLFSRKKTILKIFEGLFERLGVPRQSQIAQFSYQNKSWNVNLKIRPKLLTLTILWTFVRGTRKMCTK